VFKFVPHYVLSATVRTVASHGSAPVFALTGRGFPLFISTKRCLYCFLISISYPLLRYCAHSRLSAKYPRGWPRFYPRSRGLHLYCTVTSRGWSRPLSNAGALALLYSRVTLHYLSW
jgi:hypothetical protein